MWLISKPKMVRDKPQKSSQNCGSRKLVENIGSSACRRIVSTFAIVLCGLSAMSMPLETSVSPIVLTPQTGTGAVVKYPQPPSGFDPLSASNAELAKYGFPPRPDAGQAPDMYQQWRTMVPAPRITNPKLHQTKIYNGPAK